MKTFQSRLFVGADLPVSDSVVTASSCDARESSANQRAIIAALLTGLAGFVAGQYVHVGKRSK